MELRILLTGMVCLLTGFLSAQQFAQSDFATPCGSCDQALVCANGNPGAPATGFKMRMDYVEMPANDYDLDGYHDQWFDIYVPFQDPPESGYPVVIYAHSVGQDPTSVCGLGRALNSEGVILISWASVDETTTFEDGTLIPELVLDRGVEDFRVMMQRLGLMSTQPQVPALDWDKIFVTGVSRGARLSWKYLDDLTRPGSDEPMIAGAILAQAFPDPEWYLSDETGYETALDLVNEDYPPILFIYKDGPGVLGDIHEPNHGIEIARALDCNGVDNRVFYNVGQELDSEVWLYEQLLDFIMMPSEEYFQGERFVDLGNDTGLPNVDTPDDVQVFSNPYNETEKRVAWIQRNWNILEGAVSSVCTLKVNRSDGQGYYENCLTEEVMLDPYDIPDLGGIYPRYFFYPWTGFLDICDLGVVQDEAEYSLQVRCLLINEDEELPRKFTPWSDVAQFSAPACAQFRNELELDIVDGGVNVRASKPLQSVEVYTLADGLIHSSEMGGQNSTEIGGLPAGMYLIQALFKDGEQTSKRVQLMD